MQEKTVLFVDDQQTVLNACKQAFLDEPYQVLLAQNGQQGLDMLEECDVHVLVSDVLLPGMSGLELVKVARKKFPQTVLILMSGQPRLGPQDISSIVQALHRCDIFRFVAKCPDDMDAIKQAVRDAIERVDDTCLARASVSPV